jgi:ribosomal protein S27AE
MPNFDPAREELEHIAGDDPSITEKLGLFDLTRSGYRVRVRYRDTFVWCELYLGVDGVWTLHWKCPRCGRNPVHAEHMSTIDGHKKRIEYDPKSLIEDGGRLNVEAFTCSWELGEDRRMEFGLGLCKLALVIDNSVAREA